MHGQRRGAQALDKAAPQVARAQADLTRQRLHRRIGKEAAGNQVQRAVQFGIVTDVRAGRQFGPAAQAGPVAGRLRRGSCGVVHHAGALAGGRRAHRTAVHARAAHGGEEQAVEARVARLARQVANLQRRQGGGMAGPRFRGGRRHQVQAEGGLYGGHGVVRQVAPAC